MSIVLSDAEVQQALAQLPGWRRNGKVIERPFHFENFIKAMEFVNQIAEAAEAVNHHPDIFISYNKVTLSLISHDSGGVTQRDIKWPPGSTNCRRRSRQGEAVPSESLTHGFACTQPFWAIRLA